MTLRMSGLQRGTFSLVADIFVLRWLRRANYSCSARGEGGAEALGGNHAI